MNMLNFADRFEHFLRRCGGVIVVLVLSGCAIAPTVSLDPGLDASSSRSVSPTAIDAPTMPMDAPMDMPMDAVPAMPRSSLPVDRDRLMRRLTEFSQPRFSEVAREGARLYLEQVLRDRGWQVRREPFTVPRDAAPALEGVNLIAELPGSDPALPALLIGAHYDTVSDQSPGADDNASGAIALLEIAEVLSGASEAGVLPGFSRTLRLVWFDLEEFGLLGSFYHVAHLDRAVYGAIILEMIGYACNEPGCQQVPSGLAITLPDRGDFLGVVGNAEMPELLAPFYAVSRADDRDRDRAGYPRVVTLAVPTLLAISPNLLRSDHVPFWAQGIGALMVTDTANFRNPNYHRASDTVETIDRRFLGDSTQVVLDAAIGLLE
jgi:hypothetical protein